MKPSYQYLDDQLVEYGCRVMNHRAEFHKNLELIWSRKHFEISNQIRRVVNILSIFCQASTDKKTLSESFKIALEKVDPEIYLKRILVLVLIEMTFLFI